MNSAQFLSQLLKPSNTVPATRGQECLICQEEYGTRLCDISVAEKQIRLPCNPKHTVGSKCIVTWLQANNTCPICRYEFFPKEKKKKANIDREELLVSLLEDENEDVVDQDGDGEDEDFVDEESETEDDVNMSDEDEGMSEED